MKLKNLLNSQNPISGAKGSLIDPSYWISNIMGVLFILVVVATGQNVARSLSGRVPAIDSTIEPIINRPVTNGGVVKYTV